MRCLLVTMLLLATSGMAQALDIKGVSPGQAWDNKAIQKSFEDHAGAAVSCWSTGAGCRGVTYVGDCEASVQIDRAEVWNPGHGYEVRRIALTFDYPKCLEASLPQFMQKYGKPVSQADSLVHKSTGEATKNTTLVWQDDETVLTVKTHSSLNKSSVTLALRKDTTKPAAL